MIFMSRCEAENGGSCANKWQGKKHEVELIKYGCGLNICEIRTPRDRLVPPVANSIFPIGVLAKNMAKIF